ncbi:iron complex transport system ATP-binding protein [Thermosulfidibacter takaii ABI70S6]|uniref:Iron complex transport system ATP-binding protein n=1 Tax=Thermosulfidibacter takaii (strain DSM 17441 / JCM 13301 / NBRC 103674 / ABI70S6) TaxID=1298851 RepID=A0A0S3QRI0_THET7|nr:ABC transporter ATP-binding protein [Thermosulfidibacter takaii]BAT70940.1 iron complex transport system ATP-binding protein [Thermosulfidibacter takaii ABI70S6]
MCDILVESLRCKRGGFSLEIDKLHFKKGEKVAILGENGSGKSTLLMAMVGFLKYSGKVSYDGVSIREIPPSERAKIVSYLPQKVDVLFNYSVKDVVLMGRYPWMEKGFPRADDVARTEKVLQEYNLKTIADRGVLELSGGEQRRVFLAKTVNQDTRAILLDEPTDMMDVRYAKEALKKLLSLPATVVAVMHDVNLALSYFSRVIFLKNGRLVADVQSDFVDEKHLGFVYDTPVHRGQAFLFW